MSYLPLVSHGTWEGARRFFDGACVFTTSLPALSGQIQPVAPPLSSVLTLETRAARRWRTVGLTCSGEKKEPKRWNTNTHKHRDRGEKESRKGVLESDPGRGREQQQWGTVRTKSCQEGKKEEQKRCEERERERGGSESQHCSSNQPLWCSMQRQTGGCSGASRAAVATVAASDWGDKEEKETERREPGRQEKKKKTYVRTRMNKNERRGSLYLVQVRHEVLVERADQHVEGPLPLLGKRWRLQCGFLSIDYCRGWSEMRLGKQNKRKIGMIWPYFKGDLELFCFWFHIFYIDADLLPFPAYLATTQGWWWHLEIFKIRNFDMNEDVKMFLHLLYSFVWDQVIQQSQDKTVFLFQVPFNASVFVFLLHLTNKKSLNSWWSVNTGGDGRGGPNSGTLSSENIFNLRPRGDT